MNLVSAFPSSSSARAGTSDKLGLMPSLFPADKQGTDGLRGQSGRDWRVRGKETRPMVRKHGIGSLMVVLTGAGLSFGQTMLNSMPASQPAVVPAAASTPGSAG